MIKKIISALMGFSLLLLVVSPSWASTNSSSGLETEIEHGVEIQKPHGGNGQDEDNEKGGSREAELRNASVRTTVGNISQVDVSAKIFYLGSKGKLGRKIMAENAMLVSLTQNVAKTITLSDLTIGSKVRIYGSRTNGSSHVITAALVIIEKDPISKPSKREIQFNSSTSSGSESVTSVSIPLKLSSSSSSAVTVDYTVSGTATGGGTDFTLANGTLTIPAGQTSGSIALTVSDDTLVETDETVILSLANPSNASLGSKTTHTYTILNND